MTCRHCKKEFIPNRDWQKDCSPACHQLYWQRAGRRDYMKRREIKKIIKNNPGVDRTLFEELQETLKQLRKVGIKPKEYDILPPFSKGTLRRSSEDAEQIGEEKD